MDYVSAEHEMTVELDQRVKKLLSVVGFEMSRPSNSLSPQQRRGYNVDAEGAGEWMGAVGFGAGPSYKGQRRSRRKLRRGKKADYDEDECDEEDVFDILGFGNEGTLERVV